MVAQQILSILSALAAGSTRFVFEGREINLVWSCGIFITMNPGKSVCEPCSSGEILLTYMIMSIIVCYPGVSSS